MSRPSSTPAVVFDFGGVIISPITTVLGEIATWHDVSMVEMLDVLMGPRDISTTDHPWHRAERGELATATLQSAVAPFAARAGLELRGDEYARLLAGDFEVHHEVLDRIAVLRADGYRTGLLTNSFREFRAHLEERIDVGVFDAVIDSSEVGHRKPEPEIYRITAERLAVEPEHVLYLDDFEANLVGARAAGWRTIHVADIPTALDELDLALRA